MAGKGKRLRPQTSIIPKPLIEIAGKTIIQRIVDLVATAPKAKIKNIGFIIEKSDTEIEKMLSVVAQKVKIPHQVFYQAEAKGTAHAIYCAKALLNGPTFIIFSDTLFDADLDLSDDSSDGCVFVKEVADPSAYGVVQINSDGHIAAFIEKPKEPISNLAMVGMYYFKQGLSLAKEIKIILDQNIREKGEYQLTTALENLKNKNFKFAPYKINKWFDFGTPNNLLTSHAHILKEMVTKNPTFKNTIIKEPCFISKGVIIEDSIIGPNVSIGSETIIKSSQIQDSIIQSNSELLGATLKNSIIGRFVKYNSSAEELNIGDYCTFK